MKKDSLWFWAMLLLLELGFALTLVSPDFIREQSVKEAIAVYETMGSEAAREVESRATAWYTAVMVEPEIEKTLRDYFIRIWTIGIKNPADAGYPLSAPTAAGVPAA